MFATGGSLKQKISSKIEISVKIRNLGQKKKNQADFFEGVYFWWNRTIFREILGKNSDILIIWFREDWNEGFLINQNLESMEMKINNYAIYQNSVKGTPVELGHPKEWVFYCKKLFGSLKTSHSFAKFLRIISVSFPNLNRVCLFVFEIVLLSPRNSILPGLLPPAAMNMSERYEMAWHKEKMSEKDLSF